MGSIARIDYGYSLGWQVRISDSTQGIQHTKLFSDKLWGGEKKAKDAAQKYLEEYQTEHNIPKPVPGYFRYRVSEGTPKNNTSGVVGVYRSTYRDHRRPEQPARDFWAAHYSVYLGNRRQYRQKKFWIDKYGEERSKKLAIQWGALWEKAVESGEEALEEFFNNDRDGVYDTLTSRH